MENRGSKKQNKIKQKSNASIAKMINDFRDEIQSLSYQDSIEALDLLLAQLQSENIPVEDLQKHCLKGNLYLKHCEELLDNIEQQVVNINSASLASFDDDD